MQPLDRLFAAARAARRRIVLAEGEDPRILAAAVRAEAEGLAELTLLGRTDTVAAGLTAAGGDPARFEIIDPATAPAEPPSSRPIAPCAPAAPMPPTPRRSFSTRWHSPPCWSARGAPTA